MLRKQGWQEGHLERAGQTQSMPGRGNSKYMGSGMEGRQENLVCSFRL